MITLFSIALASTIVDVPGPTLRTADGPADVRIRRAAGDLLVLRGDPRGVVTGPTLTMPFVFPTSFDAGLVGADIDGDGDGDDELVVVQQSGELVVYDSTTFDVVLQVPLLPAGTLMHVAAGDVDGDGTDELVTLSQRLNRHLGCWDLSGGTVSQLWNERFIASNKAPLLAQVDADPGLEVLVGTDVHDGLTGLPTPLVPQLQGHAPRAAGDADGDGLDEVLYVSPPDTWTLWSAGSGTASWTRTASEYSAYAMADVGGTGRHDLFFLADRATGVEWLDATTGTVRGTVRLPDSWHCCGGGVVHEPIPGAGPRLHMGSYDVGGSGIDWAALPAFSGAPRPADLDGDGTLELVFLGPQVTVTDAAGTLLTTDPYLHRDQVDLADADGDGDLDLVTTTDGHVRRWQWRRGRGFHAPTRMSPPTSQVLTFPQVADLDGDGLLDLAFRTGSAITRIDGATGSLSPLVANAVGDWEAADLDGDGASELVTLLLVPPVVSVLSGDGTHRAAVLGTYSQVIETPGGPRVVVTNGGSAELYAFGQGAMTLVDTLVPPDTADRYWFVAGRLWYAAGGAVHAWDPQTDETLRFDVPDLTAAPVVADGSVWLSHGWFQMTITERWDLP
jgi:hypothetical protein